MKDKKGLFLKKKFFVLDNRMKKKRKGRNKEMIGGGNYPIMQGDNAKRVRISPQVTLAVFQYLTTSIEPFKNEFLAKVSCTWVIRIVLSAVNTSRYLRKFVSNIYIG